jgi:LuxR family quorum sensing-dependent transcriptional regulator
MACAIISTIGDIEDFADPGSLPRFRQLARTELIDGLKKSLGFRHVAVGGMDIDEFHFGTGRSVETDLPPAYVEAYFGEGHHLSDPLVLRTRALRRAMSQEEAFAAHKVSARLRSLHIAHGIGDRFLVPIARGKLVYGGVCFTKETFFTQNERELAVFFAKPLHDLVTGPIVERFGARALKLSPGEVRCLELAGDGLSSEAIATATDFQIETVNTYVKRAMRKLGARNRIQAVTEAVRRGIIT